MISCIPLTVVLPLLAGGIGATLFIERLRQDGLERRSDNAQLSKVQQLTAPILTGTDPREALEQTLDGTLAALNLARGLVLVPSLGSNGSSYTITKGFKPSAGERLASGVLRDYALRSGERWGGTMVFSSLRSGEKVFASWQLDPAFQQFREFFIEQGCGALAVLPLRGRQAPCGVMLLAADRPRTFRLGELRLLDSIRDQAGIALENRMLENAAERHADEIVSLHRISEALSAAFDTQKQFEILRDELRGLFGISGVWLAFQDAPEGRFEILSACETLPADSGPAPQVQGLVDYVLRARAPLMIAQDFEKTSRRLSIASADRRIRCWCGVPMHFSDGTTGVLAVADFTRENALDGAQYQLLQALASEAGVSIENARLYQREQRRARHLTLLNDVARRTSAVLDPQELCNSLCSEIRQAFGYDLVRFETLDAARGELVVEAQEGYAEEILGRRFKLGEGLSGIAAASGEPITVNGVERDPRYIALDSRARSSLNIPLKYGDDSLGVLVVETFRENGFSKQDAQMVLTLADQLAIALHNASAFKSAKQEAITDGLTHLKTHRYFMEALEAEWRRAPRSGRPFSLIMLDLDSFKRVNDRYSHLEGDRVLVAVARLLESRSRHVNPVARYGGDEFSILMPEAGLDQAEILAERLRVSLASDPYLASHGMTGSFGIANFPAHGATPDELLRVANFGMILAKHERGNCVRIASRAEGDAVDPRVLDAYLGVTVKRLFSTGPEAFEEYMSRLEQAVEGAASGQSFGSLMDTVTALAFAIDAKDHYTQGHSQSVSRLAARIGRQLGLPESQIEEIRLAGILHDIGKIGIPEQLLNKPTRLTEEEFEVIKTHAVLGERILGPLKGKGMARIRKMVRHHHEAFNGNGYPDGLRGEDIPLGARILTVADCFDTMVSKRTYKEGRTADDAIATLRRDSGVFFDHAMVEAFLQSLTIEKPGGDAVSLHGADTVSRRSTDGASRRLPN